MGRKTYDSIGKPLDGARQHCRRHARRDLRRSRRHEVAARSRDAIDLGRELADEARRGRGDDHRRGGDIPAPRSPMPDRIYLTLVHGTPTGDTGSTCPMSATWRETARELMPQGSGDQYPADFIVLERQALAPPHMVQGPPLPPYNPHRTGSICAHREGAL